MKSLESEEERAVRWCAGLSRDTPSLRDIDISKLIPVLAGHRLLARFADSVKTADLPCPAELTGEVAKQIQQGHARFDRQLQALHEIGAAYARRGQEVAVVKGPTAYLLANEGELHYGGGDIDVLAENNEESVDLLYALGFREHGLGLAPHEFASLLREDVRIELHKFLPVYAFPTDWEVMSPDQHPGIWHQELFTSFSRLTYKDIAARRSSRLAIPGIVVGDALLSAAIRYSEVLRNFTNADRMKFPLRISLGGLAEIERLKAFPEFCRSSFERLCSELGITEVVAFVDAAAMILESISSENNERIRSRKALIHLIPRQYVCFDDLWRDAIVRGSNRPMAAKLLANTIPCRSWPNDSHYCALEKGPGLRTLDRVVYQTPGGKGLAVKFRIGVFNGNLRLHVTYLHGANADSSLYLDFDDIAYWVYMHKGQAFVNVHADARQRASTDCIVKFAEGGRFVSVDISVPRRELNMNKCVVDGRLWMLLGVYQEDPARWRSTLVPLELVLPRN